MPTPSKRVSPFSFMPFISLLIGIAIIRYRSFDVALRLAIWNVANRVISIFGLKKH